MPPDNARSIVEPPHEPTNAREPLLTGSEEIELIRRALDSGQRIELRINGSCMRPWASTGDRITVERLATPPRRGMILLTQHGDDIFAHRVVRLGRDGSILTRGDLSDSADAWVRRAAVLGRAVAIRSRRGYRLRLDLPGLRAVGLASAPFFRWLRRLRG